MADSEEPTPIEGTPAAEVEMGEEIAVDTQAGAEETQLTETGHETPKLVLFAECVLLLR